MDAITILSLEQFMYRSGLDEQGLQDARVVIGVYGDRSQVYKNAYGDVGVFDTKLVFSELLPVIPREGIFCWTFQSPSEPSPKAPPPSEGYNCDRCGDYVPMSAPNMGNGMFRCYSCRGNPYR